MYSKIIPAILTLAGLAACSKSSSDSDAAAGSTTGTTRTATGAVQATSVDELGLSGALNIVLPDAIADSGSGLRLNGQKSMEACLMRESAKQLVTQIDMISSTLCHIEAEGKNIPWNTPVVLDVSEMASAGLKLADADSDGLDDDTGLPVGLPSGGTPPTGAPSGSSPTPDSSESSFTIPKIGIYADDSDGDNIAVYICEGETTDAMKLVQAFKITGSKSITKEGATLQVSKGTINISSGSDTMGTFKGAIGFDSNYTDAEVSALKLEVKFGFTGFSFAQNFELTSNDDGLTKVSISESGTMEFGEGAAFGFKNAGVGMFDAENGNVFYSYDGNGTTFATQACVDSDSYVAACTGAKFVSGGDLYLTSADVPGVLPSTFSPTAPSGFDCSTADWSETITPATDSATIAKHQACDAGMIEAMSSSGGGMSDCFSDAAYIQSSSSVDIEFTEQAPGDFEPELSLRK